MSIKNSIGLRIKTERENQQMSREVLCLDGKELTVRQLIRIEKGESLPSLDKLSYVAKRLGKSMADLLDYDRIEIPDIHSLADYPCLQEASDILLPKEPVQFPL